MTRRRILIRFASRCSALLLLVGSVACESGPAPEVDAPADPAQAGYRAQGNEPFWSLVLEQATMSFSQLGVDDTVRAERPAAERLEDGWRFAATASGEPFLVRIEDRRCNDSMSGRPFPHSIEVTVGDQVFTGCGGDTASLLVGEEWGVVRLEDTAPVHPAPTLRFEAGGVLTGTGSCNRFRATYEITGEGMVIGPAAATRMACPEPGVDAQEVRFFAALEQVTRFEIAEDGGLELLALEKPVIVARR